jgi:3',5'-cyclic AMP phosphodiesterase CpdA
MRLLAISDLHLDHEPNRRALEKLASHTDDWLILAGDVGNRVEHLEFALDLLSSRFAGLVWVPGNHDLWSTPGGRTDLRGEARYRELVEICRQRGVHTPEDPYPVWNGAGAPTTIAPLMVLYDYTFRPDEVPVGKAIDWAMETGVRCADERYLHPDPFDSRSAWCEARVAYTEQRLSEIPDDHRTVLINHFPLRQEHARLPRIPRFSIWCGTRRTEDWHERFAADVVVTGHIHIRTTRFLDGTRFEEVSLGYPRQWHRELGIAAYLREILPGNPSLKGTAIWL